MGHIDITIIEGMEKGTTQTKDVPVGMISSMTTKGITDLPEEMQAVYKMLKKVGKNVVCATLGFDKAQRGEVAKKTVLIPVVSAGILETQLRNRMH